MWGRAYKAVATHRRHGKDVEQSTSFKRQLGEWDMKLRYCFNVSILTALPRESKICEMKRHPLSAVEQAERIKPAGTLLPWGSSPPGIWRALLIDSSMSDSAIMRS